MRISLENALDMLRTKLCALPPVCLPLFETLGCITAEVVTAQLDQPPFPRSPYDGYALRAFDSKNASRENPATLIVIDQSHAGKPANVAVGLGEAVRIMTGGVIPDGADCVIPQEETDEGEITVRIYKALAPYENYCRQGEDFLRGTSIIPNAIPVTSAVLGVAASAGCTELKVFPKPKVAIVSTGDEIQTLGTPLRKGQIYDANSALLYGRLAELRIIVTERLHVCDELSELTKAIEKASDSSDLVICTGGVSVGQRDLVPAALEKLGAEMVFHGIAIKPGMPAAFALLKGKPILALSGNPFASAVTFEMLARTAISVLASNPQIEARLVKATLAEGFSRKRPVRRFQRGILSGGTVVIPSEQGNGQLRTMIGCNCLVDLPEGNNPLSAGMPVDVYLLEGEIYGI